MARRGEVILRDVSRRFRIEHDRSRTLKQALLHRQRTATTDLWVLKSVSLRFEPGESVGIVGRNGTGKSTLLKLVAGIIPPQTGDIDVGGTVAPLLELGAGFHPEFTGRENVYMQGALYGLSEGEVCQRLDQIVAFAELEEFIDMPVKTYSSGMFMRLAFAIAAHVEPDILLLDEVLAVGDAGFQRKCMARIHEHRQRGGTVLFVSHNQDDVERICERAILLVDGEVVVDASPPVVFAEYNTRFADGIEEVASEWIPFDPSHGVGTQRARITDFSLLIDGSPAKRAQEGCQVAVKLSLASEETIRDPIVGIEFHDLAGHLLFGTNTRLDRVTLGDLAGERGITFHVESLPVRTGSAMISLHLVSADEREVFHRLRDCARLDVSPRSEGNGPISFGSPRWITDGSTELEARRTS